jgi:phage recombination protein Bet
MENQIAKIQPISDEILTQFLDMFGQSKLTGQEKTQFIQISKAFNLNPFKREIHLVKFGTECNIIVGYESYIKRGESTGLLNGWKVWTEGQIKQVKKKVTRSGKNGEYEKELDFWEGDLKAVIEIKRKDWSEPFRHEVDFSEFATTKENWCKMPRFMIKKVAIGQGFRLCFSEFMGGLPYTEEEFEAIKEQKTIETDAVELNERQKEALSLLESSILTSNKKSFDHMKKEILNGEEEKLNTAIEYLKGKQPKKEEKKEPDSLPKEYKTTVEVEQAFLRKELTREEADEIIRNLTA